MIKIGSFIFFLIFSFYANANSLTLAEVYEIALNKDPELKIFKDRRKGADNSGINIYQYKCANCNKIITYNDEERKAIQFSGWDYGKLPSKQEQNIEEFNKYINKQSEKEQIINDGRGRSGSAPNLINPTDVSQDEYDKDIKYLWDPNDDEW